MGVAEEEEEATPPDWEFVGGIESTEKQHLNTRGGQFASWALGLWSQLRSGLRSSWREGSHSSTQRPSGNWLWVDDSGGHIAYSPEDQQLLETTWSQGQPEVILVSNGQTYCVDLAAPGDAAQHQRPEIPVGFQSNLRTGKRRPVYRVVWGDGQDGKQPPAPPPPAPPDATTSTALSCTSGAVLMASCTSRALIAYYPTFSMTAAFLRVVELLRTCTWVPTQEEVAALLAWSTAVAKAGLETLRFIVSYHARELWRPFCKALNPWCREYQMVRDEFRKTVSRDIIMIEKVQNDILLRAHEAKRYSMDADDYGLNHRAAGANLKWLFHGVDAKDEMAFKNIMYNGFNRSYNGKNGTAYGKGCYFARDASYSLSYCKAGQDGLRKMILASVLVGDYTEGSRDLLEPPPKELLRRVHDYPVRFDTVVDNAHDPTIYVTFHDASACPRYVITFL